jgi:HAD superfamily hydrolase (TIGR01509 family)
MIDSSIKAIVFDLGGVLINLDYHRTINAFRELGIDNFDDLFSQAQQNQIFDDFETGKISSFHFINRILDLLPKGSNPNQVVSAWNAMILDFPLKRLEILEDLSKNYSLYLLSNTNDLHMEKVRRELKKTSERPLEYFFKNTFLSQEIGLRKPTEEVFNFITSTLGLSSKEILFVDDSIQHIESANKLGFQTIHLTKELENHSSFS